MSQNNKIISENVFKTAQERKMKENIFKLEAFNKTKSFFDEALGGAHHQINNNLQKINSIGLDVLDEYEDSLNQTNMTSKDKKKALSKLEEVVDKMQAESDYVSKTLTDLRQIFTDNPNDELSIQNFKDIFTDVNKFCKNRFLNHNINYSENIVDFSINCQSKNLQKAFIAILTDAHQAIYSDYDNSKDITVNMEDLGSMIQIEITDSGKKFDNEDIDNVFTPFYQTINNRNTMSLALAQKIILSHGGTIHLEVNESNKFIICLPKLIAGSAANRAMKSA